MLDKGHETENLHKECLFLLLKNKVENSKINLWISNSKVGNSENEVGNSKNKVDNSKIKVGISENKIEISRFKLEIQKLKLEIKRIKWEMLNILMVAECLRLYVNKV